MPHRELTLVQRAMWLRPDDLGQRVVRGAAFTLLGIFLRTAITLGSVAVLARLLTPSDFGYVAMATIVTEFAALLGHFGLANILIQRKRIARIHLDTVFWASAAIGSALTLVVFASSFATNAIFGDDTSGELLRVLCITFFIGGLTVPHDAILSRLLRFNLVFVIEMLGVAIRAGAAILFAMNGYGIWSLVYGPVVGALAVLALRLVIVRYLPRLRFNLDYLRSTWKTSGSYFGSGLLYYVSMNLDLLLIGRQLGAGSLGYYSNARSLTDELRARIAMPLQRVLFPAFSTLQHDLPRMQRSVTRSARVLAAVVIPAGIGLSAIASELVPLLYGAQWLPMIPLLTFLGVSAALKGSTSIASAIFNATNNVTLAFRYNVVGAILLVAALTSAMPYGLTAVAGALAVHSLYSVFTFRVALGLIGMNTKDLFRILGYPAVASAIMWGTVFFSRLYVDLNEISPFASLGVLVLLGAMTYVVVLVLMSRQYWLDFNDILTRFSALRRT